MPFRAALSAVTLNPARVLGKMTEIGTLAVGSRADVTVLEERAEDARRSGRDHRDGAAVDSPTRAASGPADRLEPAAGARCR
jgi:predicted amidohydrolase